MPDVISTYSATLAANDPKTHRDVASSALSTAHGRLLEALWAYDRIDEPTANEHHERDIVSALVDVTDHARRVLIGTSDDYRAEKNSHLLAAAERIRDLVAGEPS